MKEECDKCNGTGKCQSCNGTGALEHECRPSTLTRLDKPEPRPMSLSYASYDSTSYHKCICGVYWKHYSQFDPGAGSSSEWLKLGDKSGYKSFTQEDLDRVLDAKNNEGVEDVSKQSETE